MKHVDNDVPGAAVLVSKTPYTGKTTTPSICADTGVPDVTHDANHGDIHYQPDNLLDGPLDGFNADSGATTPVTGIAGGVLI